MDIFAKNLIPASTFTVPNISQAKTSFKSTANSINNFELQTEFNISWHWNSNDKGSNMYWQVCAAFLLLLVWQDGQAARTTNVDALEYWQPQSRRMTQKKSGHVYPRYEFVQARFPSGGGYNRRRRLPGQGKAASTTTTERPFIRVWNSFLRSVQPNFGLRNLTNPLVNLFNNGNTNIIESLPIQTEVYNEQQHEDDDEEQQQQYVQQSVATESGNKRKRKRRKQQKRRPSVESQEQADDPYDYYGSNTLAMTQPVYYFGSNDYYGMRRLHDYQDYAQRVTYYDPYYGEESAEEEPQSEQHLGKLNTKKFTVLRPLSLAFTLPDVEESSANEDAPSSAAAAAAETDESNEIGESFIVVDSKPEENNDATTTISESTRSALGTFMRDDKQTRQRQRQSERQKSVGGGANDKTTPRRRQQQRYLFTARLVKNH